MKKSNARGAETALNKDQHDAILKYDDKSGLFTRLSSRGGCKAGSIAGSTHKVIGYVEISVNGHRYYAHRLAHLTQTGEWPSAQVDHVNHIKTDNRWKNLRPASPALNSANKAGWSSSGYKCIFRYDTKAFGERYRVQVTRDGQTVRKIFSTLDNAVAYRDEIIRESDGAFANTSHRDDN